MILVGQCDSPYVRRVAVSLHALGFSYEHDTRSVFADFDAMRTVNPHGRIPSLVLDDGDGLIDWLDQTVGPEHALLPPHGAARRRALRRIALATGAIDKIGAAAYERLIRPPALRWPEWIERCLTQGTGAMAALAVEPWPASEWLDQAQITTACMLRYVATADPYLLPPGRFPALDDLSARRESLPAFQAPWPAEYVLPRNA